MNCKEYILKNNTSNNLYFNYRKCEDNIFENQVLLEPNQIKTIWLVETSYSCAFNNGIEIIDNGYFPPTGDTPSTSVTPTSTPTNTQTPTVTPTNTPSTSVTPTITPTNTPTPTSTQTSFSFTLSSGATSLDACANYTTGNTQTYYSNKITLTISPPTALWLDSTLTTLVPRLWFADGTNVYAANVNGFGTDGVFNQQGFC